jgi:hypothetical protein
MDESIGPELRPILVFLALALCSLFLWGCGGVEIMEQVPAPLTEASTADGLRPVEHDLAILAIDFDPPLDYKELWAQREQVTLLVALENRGLSLEEEAWVSAELCDLHQSEPLLRQSTTLSSLAPGEVEVVRFSGISNVPLRRGYQLEVKISPVDGEWALTNNAKVYELTLKEPSSAGVSGFVSPLEAP